MPKLSAIYIYPVKSLPAVRLQTAEAKGRGLKGDRRWMLVDESGVFITIRNVRQLNKFKITRVDNGWEIHWENESIIIPEELGSGTKRLVRIWKDQVLAIEGQQAWNDWLSDVLQFKCSLVYLPPEGHRPISDQWQLDNEEVSFADGYPYLIINESSLNELAQKSGQKLDVKRFRPNLVIAGGKPWGEFLYRELAIGDVQFNGLKPCERCVVTTIDPETGEQGMEPLKTLATMKINNKVVFGQHATLKKAGRVEVSDEVVILKEKDSPYDPL